MAPSEGFTKSQIDRLGERLRKRDISEGDLRLLDTYRRSFAEASEYVFAQIRDRLGLEPAGRATKSTTSIVGKLRREKTRLSRMQDIAGCRLLVADVLSQDVVVENLIRLFEKVTVVDRRERPSHGYRAVHVIVERDGKLIEIQVRTSLQQAWAQVSEKLSDIVDPSIKYGVGDEEVLLILARMSDRIMQYEEKESELNKAIKTEGTANLFELAWDVYDMKEDITQMLNAIDENLARSKGSKDDLSD